MTRKLPSQNPAAPIPHPFDPFSSQAPNTNHSSDKSIDESNTHDDTADSNVPYSSSRPDIVRSRSSTNPFRRDAASSGPPQGKEYGDLAIITPLSAQAEEDASKREACLETTDGAATPPFPGPHGQGREFIGSEGEVNETSEQQWQLVEKSNPSQQTSEQPSTNLLDLMASREPTDVEIPMREPPKIDRDGLDVETEEDMVQLDGVQPSKSKHADIPQQLPRPPPRPLTSRPGSETYQIRHVNWYDFSSPTNPRRSPIMVQNANGPCPLLALVNALVLSTPYGLETALVETLRVREQVTLGLLLDAVIDELLSDRRGGAAQELPDVTELYAFLLNLHTGMNVNPSFVKESVDGSGNASDRERRNGHPGGFEQTREMRLYGTFAVPLVHGWLPHLDDPASAVLARSAKTFDEAQTILFLEQDLEDKLRASGLEEDEMQKLQDIGRIKQFLDNTATQLTEYGLEVIRESLAGGAIAILFRNDHFSTIYKNPRNGELLTLITDMGYATRDEIVWESLVDVYGEGSSYLSGDFLPVGDNHEAQVAAAYEDHDGDSGWETVGPSKRSGTQNRNPSTEAAEQEKLPEPPDISHLSIGGRQTNATSPIAEDYDRDLALALSMQMEEEERHSREAQQRRQEALSKEYIERQQPGRKRGFQPAQSGRPNIPPRNPNTSFASNSRGAPRGAHRGGGPRTFPGRAGRNSEDGVDNPPPTYEQAATKPAYHPPDDLPPPPPSVIPSTGQRAPRPQPQPRGSSAFMTGTGAQSPRNPQTFVPPASLSGAPNRNISGGRPLQRASTAGDDKKSDKDCIVM